MWCYTHLIKTITANTHISAFSSDDNRKMLHFIWLISEENVASSTWLWAKINEDQRCTWGRWSLGRVQGSWPQWSAFGSVSSSSSLLMSKWCPKRPPSSSTHMYGPPLPHTRAHTQHTRWVITGTRKVRQLRGWTLASQSTATCSASKSELCWSESGLCDLCLPWFLHVF